MAHIKTPRIAFTLAEILVSIVISGIILTGVLMFVSDTTESIRVSENIEKLYTDLADWNTKVNGLRKNYDRFTVLVSNSGGYDSVLFTNSGKTSGVILGAVDMVPGSATYLRIESTGSHSTYKRRAIGVQNVSATEIATLTGSNVGTIPFQEDSVFASLFPDYLKTTPYNAGVILEVEIGADPDYRSALE